MVFYSILYYYILFYSVLFYSILFSSILFYSILFCSIIFCSILFYSIIFYVAFLWNFFISREAATAERGYEKERQSVNYMHTAAFSARTNLFSPLPALPLPLSHLPPINVIRGAGLRPFPPPPSPTHVLPMQDFSRFWRPRPKSRTASI